MTNKEYLATMAVIIAFMFLCVGIFCHDNSTTLEQVIKANNEQVGD